MGEQLIPLPPEEPPVEPSLTPVGHAQPQPEPEPEPGPVGPTLVPPVTPGPAADISKLALWLIILGLIAAAAALIQAFNNLFKWFLGPLFKRAGSPTLSAQQFTQTLSNALGASYQSIDADVAMILQRLNDTAGRSATVAVATAGLALQIAERVGRLEGHSTGQDQQQAKTATQAAQAAQEAALAAQAAKTLSKGTAAALGALRASQSAETTHVTHLIEPEIDGLKARIHELERGAESAWDLLKQHEDALGVAGLAAGVATGLAQLGSSWIRCDANAALGKANCGLPKNLLNDLLAALAVVAFGTFTLQELAKYLQDGIKDIEGLIVKFWGADLTGPGDNPGLGVPGGGLTFASGAGNPSLGQSGG